MAGQLCSIHVKGGFVQGLCCEQYSIRDLGGHSDLAGTWPD